eukprot:15439459-Alexandrium_andersonii.AAC.1
MLEYWLSLGKDAQSREEHFGDLWAAVEAAVATDAIPAVIEHVREFGGIATPKAKPNPGKRRRT